MSVRARDQNSVEWGELFEESEKPAISIHLLENLFHVFFVSAREHEIGLVDDEHFQIFQIERLSFQMRDSTTGRGDYDVGKVDQKGLLRTDVRLVNKI